MAHIEAATPARRGVPARPYSTPAAGRVEADSRHHHEHMPAFCVYCKPFSESGATPVQVCVAGGVRIFVQKTRFAEYKRGGTRAIVRGVMVASVTASPAVRLVDNLITCGNDALYARRGILWCYGPTVTQNIRSITLAVHVLRRICILLHLLLLRTPEQHKQHYRKQ